MGSVEPFESAASCSCDAERPLTRSATYTVTPAAGGGWPAWTAALTRLLVRFTFAPAHCIVVTQEPNQRYVQLMVGHGHAHVEASSNTYLAGDFRLDSTEERALAALGFEPPAGDPDKTSPDNWWFDADRADPEHIAGLLTATMIGVMGFDVGAPLTVETFGADSPCNACFWDAA